MGTTEATTTTKPTSIWHWVLSHLLILALVGALVLGGVYGVDSMIAKHDHAKDVYYAQLLADDNKRTEALESKLDSDTKAHAAEAQAYQQQIAADQVAMKQRDDMMKVLVAKIGTMTAPQVAADLQPKLRAGTATVLADGVKLDLPAARDVDQQITEGATAKQDLVTVEGNLVKETTIATNAVADLKTANDAVASEKGKNVDQVKACNQQIDTVKADARKGKMKWFLIGYVSGFLTRVFTVK